MLWQVPALSLTAQAFLFTISLGEGTSTIARVIAGVLGFVSAVISVQLLQKIKWLERLDRRILEELEKKLGVPVLHAHPKTLATFVDTPANVFVGIPSSFLWSLGLALFGLTSLSVAIVASLWPSLLK